ncbi:ankyrin repeat-containing domain protein [Hypoxylon sp. NC1633]|nr:ankyrin repeat-containing domain protein [Hypoxylon sp. NC1633]
MMASKKITEAQWADAKHRIKHFYIDSRYSLKELRVNMMEEGFVATEGQYRTQLRKWGPEWNKNRKSEDTEMLSVFIAHRKASGKESEVYEWGRLVPKDDIRKIIARSNPTMLMRLKLISDSEQRLPKQLVIRTPMLDRTSELTFGLPFSTIDKAILACSASPGITNTINPQLLVNHPTALIHDIGGSSESLQQRVERVCQQLSSTRPTFFTRDARLLSTLDSILPRLTHQASGFGSLMMQNVVHNLAPPLYRQVLHSAANNFSAVEWDRIKELVHFLKETTSTNLYPLILSSPSYSTRSMAQSLLKAAVDIGDVATVKAILSSKCLAIDINEEIYLQGYHRCTLIERASTLRDKELIKIMLGYGADVNKSYPCINWCKIICAKSYLRDGALSRVVHNALVERDQPDPEIIRILLEAGSHVTYGIILDLIEQRWDDLVLVIVSMKASTCHAKWAQEEEEFQRNASEDENSNRIQEDREESCWGRAVLLLDEETSLKILRILHEANADLNFDDLHNAAALKGSSKLVQSLLAYGAAPADETLCCAVESGDEDLVQFFLDYGISAHSPDEDPCSSETPLELAIRNGNGPILDQLTKADHAFRRHYHLHMALMAVTNNKDMKPLLDFIQGPGIDELQHLDLASLDLETALCSVIADGDYDAAAILLNLSMSFGHDPRREMHQKALVEAVRGNNQRLVSLLLGFGADPTMNQDVNCYENSISYNNPPDFSYPVVFSRESPHRHVKHNRLIALAADCGNHSMVRTLLAAGAEPDLLAAVKRKDQALMAVLFEAGANADHEALEGAAKFGDTDIIRWLLDHGADPHNSTALERAYLAKRPAFNLLVTAHKERYPRKKRGFASSVLCHLISVNNGSGARRLLNDGADPNGLLRVQGSSLQVTPFGVAIHTGCDLSLVELLLREGCDPNGVVQHEDFHLSSPDSEDHFTAFHFAIDSRNIGMVEMLIRNGADVNLPAIGNIRLTPLQFAAMTGCFEMVELLYNSNADVNAPPSRDDGMTALQYAALRGYNRIVCYLLSLKADVDAPGSMIGGCTALEAAAVLGRTDTVHILLQAGAGSRGKDKAQFESAIVLARKFGHYPTADLIQDYLRKTEEHGHMAMGVDIEEFINLDGDVAMSDAIEEVTNLDD